MRSVDELFETYNRKGNFVAGVVIEPVQAEGGDHHGSPAFFQVSRSQNSPSSKKKDAALDSSVRVCSFVGAQGLQALTHKHGAALIVDEVQTGGGASGKFWCHEHFDLPKPADLVTFSKKMLTGGFYSLPEFRLSTIPIRFVARVEYPP